MKTTVRHICTRMAKILLIGNGRKERRDKGRKKGRKKKSDVIK